MKCLMMLVELGRLGLAYSHQKADHKMGFGKSQTPQTDTEQSHIKAQSIPKRKWDTDEENTIKKKNFLLMLHEKTEKTRTSWPSLIQFNLKLVTYSHDRDTCWLLSNYDGCTCNCRKAFPWVQQGKSQLETSDMLSPLGINWTAVD